MRDCIGGGGNRRVGAPRFWAKNILKIEKAKSAGSHIANSQWEEFSGHDPLGRFKILKTLACFRRKSQEPSKKGASGLSCPSAKQLVSHRHV